MQTYNSNKKILFIVVALFIVSAVSTYQFLSTKPSSLATQTSREVADLKLSTFADHAGAPSQINMNTTNLPENNNSAAAATKAKCDLVVSSTNQASGTSATSYVLSIKNSGRGICSNPSLSLYYSSGQTFLSATPQPTASDYYWELQSLRAGQTKQISFVLTTTSGTAAEYSEFCATASNGKDFCGTLGSSDVGPVNPGSVTPPPVVVIPPVTPPTVPALINLTGLEYGSWVWNSPMDMSSAYINTILSTAVANKMTVLYVTVDDYLAIDILPAGTQKEMSKQEYMQKLESFISAANSRGIVVDIEAGWRDWAEDPNFVKAKTIAKFAKEYNTTHASHIRNLQYDVEPYLLSTYETNKATVLSHFVNMTNAIAIELGSSSVGLSMVIPHFYDDSKNWTPAFAFNGVTTHAFNHLLSILDTRSQSTIILMSYRNFAQGSDGAIEISNTEVQEASASNHSTKIIVAQETGNVQPAYVTYFGTSKSTYINQVQLILNQFSQYSNFGGIAAHYIDPFMLLQ